MIDAQREATGKLPSYWESTVAPAVKLSVVLGLILTKLVQQNGW